MADEIKSKYPGVYYSIVPGPGGRGSEKKFYIKYRRGGRGSKEIHELLGSESQGWTEKRASDERLRRKAGDAKSNTEKREAILDERKESRANATYNEVWAAYQEINSAKSSINKVDRSRHSLHVAPFLGERV